MVDLMEPDSTTKKFKFSPKFEESPKKKAKKKKNQEDHVGEQVSPPKKKKMNINDDENVTPAKKKKGTPENTSKSTEKKKKKDKHLDENKENQEKSVKKKVQINEEVHVKEIPKENKKKAKLDLKIKKKQKFTKAGNPVSEKFKKKFDKEKLKKKVVLLDKKETRDKQKKVKEIRKKFKQEDVFDIGVKAKKVWEEVRREDCPEGKKDRLINELHSLVQGNIKKIIYAHDTVRVVECLMALGSDQVRDKLFIEMKDEIVEMSKSKYAHFFVQKMLRYGSKEQKQIIIKEMEGKVAKLMRNKTAGNVIEMIYNDIATGPQRTWMLQEFLDQQFLVFKDLEVKTVPDILAKYPARANDCKKELQKNVEVLIRKGCYNHSLVHTVIYNHLLVADAKQRTETIEQLRDALVHMVHTREGAYTALQCIWHGTTKDRKAIVKNFKTYMLKTAQEEYGHMVLLGIFDSVDDTKLVGKAVIGELLESLTELFDNKFGVRVLKYLFGRRDPTYVNKDHIAILEKGDGNEHSKKDADVRHKELVAVASPAVLKYIIERFPGNLYEPATTITLTCILNNCQPSPELSEAFGKLATLVTKPFSKGDAAPNLVENTGSNMLFKKIILKDADRHSRQETTFSTYLLNHLTEDSLEAWLSCNRGCLLLLTMMNSQIQEICDKLKQKLKPMKKLISKLDSPSGKILQEKLAL